MGLYQGNTRLSSGGKSAYQQAVDGGYTGSEDDFNKLLAGIPGNEKQEEWDNKISKSEIGVPGGVATLGEDGKVSDEQLPDMGADAYTKAQSLTSTTAEQYGLDSTAVPDDILSWLGRYNEHWWSALHEDASYEIGMSNVTKNIYIYDYSDREDPEDRPLYVSKTVSVIDGSLVLDNQIEYVGTTRNMQGFVDEYAPCYISNLDGDPTGIYYLPEGTTVQTNAVSESKKKTIHWSSDTGAVMLASDGTPRAKQVAAHMMSAGETTYEHSLNRDEYPDNKHGAKISEIKDDTNNVTLAYTEKSTSLSNYASTLYYSSEYDYDPISKSVVLKNPLSISCTPGSSGASAAKNILGKYFTTSYNDDSNIYFADNDANISYTTSTYATYIDAHVVNFEIVDDKNGSIFYKYLGVPFDKFPTAPQIEAGEYVGTGVYGSGNENSLTFSFVPKIVIIGATFVKSSGSGAYQVYTAIFIRDRACNIGSYRTSTNTGSILPYLPTTWQEKALSWYNSSSAAYQLNESGMTYNYVAIG